MTTYALRTWDSATEQLGERVGDDYVTDSPQEFCVQLHVLEGGDVVIQELYADAEGNVVSHDGTIVGVWTQEA